MKKYQRVAALIDLDAIEENFEAMRAGLPAGTKMAAVVKANGYGHGAVPIARLLESKDAVWGFAAATIEEALALRSYGIRKPVLVLGYVFPDAYERLVEQEIRPTVFRMDMARELSREAVRQKKTVPVHIKLDTGMSRIGFADTEESLREICEIHKLPGLALEGLFTHFARADEADKRYADRQFARFLSFRDACAREGIEFPICHCANSAAIIDMPETGLNLARAGIALYGLYPSGEVKKERVALRPAMELKSHIVHIKEVPAGTQISYGGIYTAPEARRIATIPVGYGDGYPRCLSNGKGKVLLHGKLAPVVGLICMDQMVVDVNDIPQAAPGDVATLLGGGISYTEYADWCDTNRNECLSILSRRPVRVYRQGGRVVTVLDSLLEERSDFA